MNLTRNGKIARLPGPVRLELNRRLQDGEQGKKLVAWLNGLPEVRAIVAAEFGGRKIREQNLSEWKQGGYRDWLAKQEAMEIVEQLAEDTAEFANESRAPLTDILAHWLVARYAVATRNVAETGGQEGWRLLREMCSDIVELRKGDHSAERLRIDQERLKLEKENGEKRVCEKLATLLKQQGKDREPFTPEKWASLVRLMFGERPKTRDPGYEAMLKEVFEKPVNGQTKGGLTSETTRAD